MSRPRLFLIDSFGFIFRAYHARARMPAPTMRTSTGVPTEAVYIFTNMLRKLRAQYKPEYLAAVFECAGPTFREQEFADYKANRPEMPPELGQQIGTIRRLLESMRTPVLEFPGFEADDVIGAIARRAEAAGMDVAIVSSDKDMLQLVNERVSMYNPMQEDLWYDPARVEEKMGVRPEQVADLLALKGDAIDNIPGAPGIGDKGAREIVLRFGSVEAALDRAAELGDKGFGKRYRESLEQNRGQVLLSKRLATIDVNVPIEFDADALRTAEPDAPALAQLYKELEFYSLLKELGPEEDKKPRDYAALDSAEALAAWLAAIEPGATLAVAVGQGASAGDDGAPMFAVEEEPAVGLAWRAGEARAVPGALFEKLRPLLEDEARPKIAHDVKQVSLALAGRGVDARGFREDVMLYAFLLNADPSGCSLETLVRKHLDRPLETAVERQADCALELAASLRAQVDARGFRQLYETIDLPLAGVLARMERTGVLVDRAELHRLSTMMDAGIERLTREIYELAGKQFNINSPQQLGKTLFEDL
jgi:DNA polymerase-1